jgi:hypothetical protein
MTKVERILRRLNTVAERLDKVLSEDQTVNS